MLSIGPNAAAAAYWLLRTGRFWSELESASSYRIELARPQRSWDDGFDPFDLDVGSLAENLFLE